MAQVDGFNFLIMATQDLNNSHFNQTTKKAVLREQCHLVKFKIIKLRDKSSDLSLIAFVSKYTPFS